MAPYHTTSLKGLINTNKVSTDDWNVAQFDLLDDLDFELSQFDMHFEYDFVKQGDNKHLDLTVYKTKDNKWHLCISSKKSREQKPRELEFKSFDEMMKAIHKIFSKY